jgi:uncharacterized protein
MDQVAALPYRILPGVANLAGEAVDVLLVTSRETGRWVLPKGNMDAGETPEAAAAREAAEEAGAGGTLTPTPIGTYDYEKRAADGSVASLSVAVFPLHVRDLAADWPERKDRERRWFSRAEAAAAVDEPDLRELIAGFAG